MTKGLNLNSDLAYIKKLFGCDSLDQLFLFFRDSPAINNDFELEWDHKTNYRHSIGPKAFALTPARNHKDNANIFNSPGSFHNTVSINPEDINIRIMHSKIFDLITQWIRTTSSTDSDHHAQWHKWLWKGLKSTNTLKDLRRIMGINDLQEYLDSMQYYPILYDRFRFYWSNDRTKLHYSITLTPTPPAPEAGDHIITKFKRECNKFSSLYDAKLNAIKRGIYELD